MLDNSPTPHPQSCKECIKNQNLIKKYEKLTHLYEKKQLKLSHNGSSTISNGRTTNYTIDAPSAENHCSKMAEVLGRLVKNRLVCLFRLPLQKSAKKFLLLNISNRIAKSAKANAFTHLKQYSRSASSSIATASPPQQPTDKSVQKVQHYAGFSVIQQLLTQTIVKPDQTVRNIIEDLGKLKASANEVSGCQKMLKRKNMQLQIANKRLENQNKFLKQCVQELDKRLNKENQKKRETLEELAEEISEKNEEIHQLKESLRAYENAHGLDEKVLEDDLMSMRKDLDQMEKLNQRLNIDLEKVKNQLFDANTKIKRLEEKSQAIQKQCQEANKAAFELTLKDSATQKLSAEYQKLLKSLQSKLKRLAVYEKQLESTPKSLLTSGSISQSGNVQQELKSELILLYLTNLADPDYTLHSEQLFDEEEKGLLVSHKQNWIAMANEAKGNKGQGQAGHAGHAGHKMDCLEISEIEMRNQMDSVFNALDSPRERREGPTMRMLELQLQNNRQVGKITELKQKFLHIRIIILRLLKSLQLHPDLKSQAKDILRVLFDLFEYSQEERESIFTKKRRMFGFM